MRLCSRSGLSRQLLQQLFPHIQQLFPRNRNCVRRIRADPHLIAFDLQHRNRDLFAGWGFNDEGFAWATGEYEHVASLPALWCPTTP